MVQSTRKTGGKNRLKIKKGSVLMENHLESKRFEDFLKDKHNPLVYCLLSVDGEDFLVKNSFEVTLHQKTNAHDEFTIVVPDDALDSFEGYLFEHSKYLLGKNIGIGYWRYGSEQQRFSGIITGIRNKRNDGGGYGTLYITGKSPSVLLENGKVSRSFEHQNLEQILKDIGKDYPSEAQIHPIQLNNKMPLPYTVQYKESDFEFIQRLAIRYGEYFYYNGQQLIFGNKVEETIELGENRELIDVEISLETQAQDFGWVGYDAERGERWEKSSQGKMTQWKENSFQTVALNASKKLFNKVPQSMFNHLGNDSEAEVHLLKEKENREGVIWVKGRSREPNLKIGSRVRLIDINDKAMETYRILEIKHYHNGNEYYNEFVGIPDVFHPPYQNSEALPIGEEQMAKVVDNNDPLGMGRVRVQMAWQEHNQTKTPWIRLVQPYAGSDKGFYFIPEIGEEVLIGFEGGNAEKPYIIGTQYNGKEKSGYADSDNKIKAIHTRSGHIMKFTEEESIIITDKSGNEIHLDTTGGNINITAPNTMTLNAKNLNINVSENMTTSVGMNTTETIGMNKTISVGMMKALSIGADFMTNVVGKLTYFVKGDMETYGEQGHKVVGLKEIEVNSGGSMHHHSEKEVQNNSNEHSKSF